MSQQNFSTEFFALFQAYCRIIESSRIFGKCPLTWNPKKARIVLDLRIWPYSWFWYKTILALVACVLPVHIILLRYLLNWFSYPEILYEDNVPFSLIVSYMLASILTYGLIFIYIPVLYGWKKHAIPEIENSLDMYIKLSIGKIWKSIYSNIVQCSNIVRLPSTNNIREYAIHYLLTIVENSDTVKILTRSMSA